MSEQHTNTNAELAHLFQLMASALQLLGENPFKVNAHNRVARTLKDLTQDIRSVAEQNPDHPAKQISKSKGSAIKVPKK